MNAAPTPQSATNILRQGLFLLIEQCAVNQSGQEADSPVYSSQCVDQRVMHIVRAAQTQTGLEPVGKISLSVVYAAVAAAGLLGNALVLAAACVQWRHVGQQGHNVLIANLALANFLLAIMVAPMALADVWFQPVFPFGHVVCTVLQMAPGANIYCSTLTIMAMAVDRYYHATRLSLPQTGHHAAGSSQCAFGGSPTAALAAVLTWMLAMALSVPLIVYSTLRVFPIFENIVVTRVDTPPYAPYNQTYSISQCTIATGDAVGRLLITSTQLLFLCAMPLAVVMLFNVKLSMHITASERRTKRHEIDAAAAATQHSPHDGAHEHEHEHERGVLLNAPNGGHGAEANRTGGSGERHALHMRFSAPPVSVVVNGDGGDESPAANTCCAPEEQCGAADTRPGAERTSHKAAERRRHFAIGERARTLAHSLSNNVGALRLSVSHDDGAHGQQHAAHATTMRHARGANYRRARCLLMLMAGCYALMWLPFTLTSLLEDMRAMGVAVGRVPAVLDQLAKVLMLASCSVNPVLYAFMNRNYQRALKALLRLA